MQNSQSSNPTAAKLLEVDADLAAQEAQLSAQIQSIQEKRHSLKTVIDMFSPAHNTADTVPVATPAPVTEAAPQPITSDVVLPELDGALADTTEAQTSEVPQPQQQQAKKNSSPSSSQQNKKSDQKVK